MHGFGIKTVLSRVFSRAQQAGRRAGTIFTAAGLSGSGNMTGYVLLDASPARRKSVIQINKLASKRGTTP